LDTEQVGDELGHGPGQAEEQNQGQTDDERRRDDRQHRECAQAALVAKARARQYKGKDKAQHRGDEADENCQE